MTYPQVIIAGRRVAAPQGALVIDYGRGRFWRDGVLLGGTVCGYTTTAFRIVALLIASGVGHVQYRCLFDALWGGDPEGGPADPAHYSAVCIHKYRHVLDALGIHVRGDYKGGFEVLEVSPAEVAALQERRQWVGRQNAEGHRMARQRRRGHRPMPAAGVYA